MACYFSLSFVILHFSLICLDIKNTSLNVHLAEAYRVNETFEIENFTYQSDALTNLIFNNVEDTSFSGITVWIIMFKNLMLTFELLMIPLQGNVSFNDNGVRAPNMQRVYQFRNIIYGEQKSSLTRSIIIIMLIIIIIIM